MLQRVYAMGGYTIRAQDGAVKRHPAYGPVRVRQQERQVAA